MRSKKSTLPCSVRRKQRGITFVESLTAAVIVAVALIALVSTWLYSVRAAMLADDRGSAYQVARTVLERARVTDWQKAIPGIIDPEAINQPVMISAPLNYPTYSRSDWTSPSYLRYRFYNGFLDEIGGGSNTLNPPNPPNTAEFRAITTVMVSPFTMRPADRDDLSLITISVVVHKVNTDGSVQADPLTTLQTCLTQGGL